MFRWNGVWLVAGYMHLTDGAAVKWQRGISMEVHWRAIVSRDVDDHLREPPFVPRLEIQTLVCAPCERCFDLARSVELHTQSTAQTGEQVVGGRATGLLALGESVTWRARHFGIWQKLTSEITRFEPPTYFRDSMVAGAFKRFDHDHFFEANGPRETLVTDVFDYDAPLGLLGRLAERLVLDRYLVRFLATRNAHLKAIAESDRWKAFLPG